MLTGELKNWRENPELTPFAPAFEFLEQAAGRELAPGKYEIPFPGAYVELQEKELLSPLSERFEAHERFVDIQCLFSGKERLLITSRNSAAVHVPYDDSRDLGWFKHSVDTAAVELRPGEFVFFFPEDVHQPGCVPEGVTPGTKVLKAVVKWPVAALRR